MTVIYAILRNLVGFLYPSYKAFKVSEIALVVAVRYNLILFFAADTLPFGSYQMGVIYRTFCCSVLLHGL